MTPPQEFLRCANPEGVARGGKQDYDKLEAVRFVVGFAGGTIDYEGARDWIAQRLSQ